MAKEAVTRTGEASVSRREDPRAAGGVVAVQAARTEAAGTPRRVCCLSAREGVGVGKGGAGARGDGAAGEPGSAFPLLRGLPSEWAQLAVRPLPAASPPDRHLPRARLGLRGGGGARGGLRAGAGRRLGEDCVRGPLARWVAGPGAEMGRAGAGAGAGAAPGLPRKSLTSNSRLVGGGSAVGRSGGLAGGGGISSLPPSERRRLLHRGLEGRGPSWGARGAAGPRGSLLRSSNEWAPRRLRSETEPGGKTSPESGLRSHDGGRGGRAMNGESGWGMDSA